MSTLQFSPDGRYIFAENRDAGGNLPNYFICDVTASRAKLLPVALRTPFVFLDNTHIVGWKRKQVSESKIIPGISPLIGDFKLVSPPANFAIVGALPHSRILVGRMMRDPDADYRNELWTWDADSKKAPQFRYRFPKQRTNADDPSSWDYILLSDGKSLLICHGNGTREIFDVVSKKRSPDITNAEESFLPCPVAGNGSKLIFLQPESGIIGVWDCETKQPLKKVQLKYYGNKIKNVGMFLLLCDVSNEFLAAVDGPSTTIFLWDTETGQLVREITTQTISNMNFSPDGRTLATGHYDGKIQLWRIK